MFAFISLNSIMFNRENTFFLSFSKFESSSLKYRNCDNNSIFNMKIMNFLLNAKIFKNFDKFVVRFVSKILSRNFAHFEHFNNT